MKRILIIIGIGLALLLLGAVLAVHTWIGNVVKEKITIAQQQYPGTAEDALLAFLLDENNSAEDRTHTAIWTLGQIRSEKALPVLKELYKNDPKGKTCFGRHDSVLCQYEIHKAIVSIEKKWLFSHPRLNK